MNIAVTSWLVSCDVFFIPTDISIKSHLKRKLDPSGAFSNLLTYYFWFVIMKWDENPSQFSPLVGSCYAILFFGTDVSNYHWY